MPLDRKKQKGFYTREAIKREYAELCCKLKTHHVPVKELCSSIPISRNTFYMYFADIASVADEIEEELINGFLTIYDEFSDTDFSSYQRGEVLPICLDTLLFIKMNSVYFRAFAGKIPDYCFIENWKKIIIDSFKDRWEKQNVHYENEDFVLETTAMSVIAAYSYWLEHEDKIDLMEMCKFLGGKICFDQFTLSNKK